MDRRDLSPSIMYLSNRDGEGRMRAGSGEDISGSLTSAADAEGRSLIPLLASCGRRLLYRVIGLELTDS